jgi:archaellum component FlaC
MSEPVSRNKAITVTIGFSLVVLGLMYVIGQREAVFNSRLERMEFEIERMTARVEYVNERISRVALQETRRIEHEIDDVAEEVTALRDHLQREEDIHHHHGKE